MKQYLVILILCFSTVVFSQQKSAEQLEREARENVREGNMLYNQLKFSEAEIAYKKALSKNPNYPKASYNLGNAVYQQQRNKEAVNQFELVEKTFANKMDKAEAYHNMGNSFMNEKKYDKAVEAYKNSLRNNSKDDETRYNLAMAKELLEKQQQQQQQNKNQKNNNENKDNKDQKNKDKQKKDGDDNEKEQDKKDQNNKENDKNDSKQNKDKKEEDKKQQPRPNQLTPEQMKQLLEAMNNEENKTQKKLNAKTAKGIKIKQEKDW